MSKRNFILLVIVFTILTTIFVAVYFNQSPRNGGTEDGGFLSNLNPFGKSNSTPGYTTPSYATPSDDTNNTPGEIIPNLFSKISSMPVAGYGIFQKERVEKEFFPAVRYADRATGNIYQTFVDDIKERKFSTTIIPTVYEAVFDNNGDTAILRYLKNDGQTIQTFLGTLPKESLGSDVTEGYELKGYFLPDNISDLSLSLDATNLFYLLKSTNSVSGITLSIKDSKKTQIFDSQFTEWLPWWGTNNTISLTTKASGNTLGYMYTLDTSRKFTKTLGGTVGLTTLGSPDGKMVLLSDSSLTLSVYNTTTREIRTLGLQTLPEKCAWSKDSLIVYCAVPRNPSVALYPDSWYQGEISFDDQIWNVDIVKGTTTLIADPFVSEGGEQIDAIKLSLDTNENYLFFVNKKDSFFWKLDLK